MTIRHHQSPKKQNLKDPCKIPPIGPLNANSQAETETLRAPKERLNSAQISYSVTSENILRAPKERLNSAQISYSLTSENIAIT